MTLQPMGMFTWIPLQYHAYLKQKDNFKNYCRLFAIKQHQKYHVILPTNIHYVIELWKYPLL